MDPDCIRAAAACFAALRKQRAGLVGCQQRSSEECERILWGGSLEGYPLRRHKQGTVGGGQCDQRSQEEWVPLSATFIHEDVLEEIGTLDRQLYFAHAALDYSFRARSQGWKCVHEPAAFVLRNPNPFAASDPEREAQADADADYFRNKWIDAPFNLFTQHRLYSQRSKEIAQLREWRIFGRKGERSGESLKAEPRRRREGFFERYCQGRGLDIGYGGDLIVPNAIGWDLEHGDATLMSGLPPEDFDFVYGSHVLEHLPDCERALRSWWRLLRPGGYLIICVPERDLYEKKLTLPSNWNPDHRHFFLLEKDEPPDTLGLLPLIQRALPAHRTVYAKRCDAGHTITDPRRHSDGEYSLEVVLQKSL